MIPGKETLRRALSVVLAALLAVVGPALCAQAESVAPIAVSSAVSDADWLAAAQDGAQENPGVLLTTLFMNSHEVAEAASGETVGYYFTPTVDDEYIFRSFPIEAEPVAVSACLIRESDGRQIAVDEQAEGFLVRSELTAGETYRLDVRFEESGSVAVEVMPDARGRCFDNPIALPTGSIRYAKTIVQPRDVHWFSFTAPVSGLYSVRTEQAGEVILDTRGYLLDAAGRVLAYNDDILFPGDSNFMIEAELTAGETYFIRISAFSNLTGAYRLVLVAPQEGQSAPEQVSLSEHELTLDVDQKYTLSAQIAPSDALSSLVYASSDQSVLTVEPDGTLRARSAGEATVWVYSMGGASDSCRVVVRPVEASGMTLPEQRISLYTGERYRVLPLFEPENTTDQSARYESSDESVARVDESGWVSALSGGEATITVTAQDGGFTACVTVVVPGARPAYRALVLGEHGYQEEERMGGENTAQGVADMLSGQSIDGGSYQVTLMMDSTRAQIEAGIREAFAGAVETDISLLYINCHGAYEEGVAYLRLHDEDRITVEELADMLNAVPGKIIVLLDFCQSGSFIGRGGEFEQFFSDSSGAFASETPLTNEKYIVLASAGADEESYRRSFSNTSNEASTAAIMGRSLCEGAGWDLIYDRSVALKADANRDRTITVQEIYEYTRRRVTYYLEGTGATQTVYLYPEGDQTVLFGRN